MLLPNQKYGIILATISKTELSCIFSCSNYYSILEVNCSMLEMKYLEMLDSARCSTVHVKVYSMLERLLLDPPLMSTQLCIANWKMRLWGFLHKTSASQCTILFAMYLLETKNFVYSRVLFNSKKCELPSSIAILLKSRFWATITEHALFFFHIIFEGQILWRCVGEVCREVCWGWWSAMHQTSFHPLLT